MKKKLLALVLVIVLGVTAVVGGTLAYQQDSVENVNVMTLGNVDIEQTEDFEQGSDLYPGVAETKEVTVTNTGSRDAYVRTVIAFEIGSMDENYLDITWDSDTYTKVGVAEFNDSKYVLYVVYNALLASGDSYTALNAVGLTAAAGNAEIEAIDGNNNGKFEVLVVSQAIQTAGFTSADEALNEGFGAITTTTHPWAGEDVEIVLPTLVNTAEELQAALDTAEDGDTIALGADITGNVTVTQKEGVKITIDGAYKKFNGTITVDGKSARYETAGVTIKNVNFVEGVEDQVFVSLGVSGDSNNRYTNNVTVENCTFSGALAVAVKSYTGGDWNLTIDGCTVNEGMHSLVQVTNVEKGLTITDCKVYSKNGANLNNTPSLTMDGCTFDVQGYAVRFGVNGSVNTDPKSFAISNSILNSACEDGDAVIIFRENATYATLTLTNTALGGTTTISGDTEKTTIIGLEDAPAVADSNEDLAAAVSAGGTVIVTEGTYTFPASSMTADTTLICQEGTVFEGTSSLNINGATVVGATFEDEDKAVSGTINGTFKDCTFDASEALRWCYTKSGETAVFENCVINTDFRGFHFDQMDGDVIFRNCEINGFNAYGGTGTATFENCTFGYDESSYNGLNIYSNTKLINCTFNYISGKTNFIDMEGTGKTLTITNCTATLDGEAANVIDFVGGSKLAENTVVVNGTSMTYVSDGLYTDANSNYYVYNAAGLQSLNQYFADEAMGHKIWGATFNIMADINASEITWNSVSLNTPNNDCTGFTVNGNGHTISGLTISGSGMFTSTANGKNTDVPATFKNLTFDRATVNGGFHTGIIWGQMYGDIALDNVHVTNSNVTGTCNVGALVGRNGDEGASTVAYKNCSVTNTKITATGDGDPNGASVFQGSALTITNSASVKITFENCSQSGNTLSSAQGQVGGGIYAWWNASTNEYDVVNDFTAYN